MQQLLVSAIQLCAIIWDDRNAVVKLKSEAMHAVVNNDGLPQIDSLHDCEVLDMHAFGGSVAVLSIQSVVKEALLGLDSNEFGLVVLEESLFLLSEIIQLSELSLECVDDDVRIALVTGRKDDKLVVLLHVTQALVGVWPNVDSCFQYFTVALDTDLQVVWVATDIFDAVHQCLVQVKEKDFFVRRHQSHLLLIANRHISDCLYVLQTLQRLHEMSPV